MKMKAVVATVISLALTTMVIGNAYYQKKQFYPSVVYLTNSNPSMAVSTIIFIQKKTYFTVFKAVVKYFFAFIHFRHLFIKFLLNIIKFSLILLIASLIKLINNNI